MTQPSTAGSVFSAADASTALPNATAQEVADIIIAATSGRRDAQRVNLVGQIHTFHPVKTWFTMKIAQAAKAAESDPMAMLDALREWLRQGFGDDGAAAILARLDDPADRLDLTDLMRLMEATMKVDDNPPT